MKKLIFFITIILLIVIADQWSKVYVSQNFKLYESVGVIDGFLNFTFAKNTGAAFSFGGGFSDWLRTILFKILPVIACFWLCKLLYNSIKESMLMSWAYTLILGGAIGNLIDRIRLDYVVDFIAVYSRKHTLFGFELPEWHFAIFNIADSAISIAAVLIIADFFLNKKADVEEAKS